MSETSFTPGPWRKGLCYKSVVADTDTGYEDKLNLEGYGGHLICEGVKWSANAHLIIAAPDLYLSLEKAVRQIEQMGGDGLASGAYAALKRARGEV